MPIKYRIGMLFGRQYVFVRCAHNLTFQVRRAYKISGRWYIRHKEGNVAHQLPPTKHWQYQMLTKHNMYTTFVEPDVSPGDVVFDRDLWFPITTLIEAHIVMQDD